MSAGFVHLRVRSRFSPGGPGGPDPTDLPRAALAAGMPAVALTDVGTLIGIPSFVRAAEAAGVKPIPGVEVPVRFVADRPPFPVLLLCLDPTAGASLVAVLNARGQDGTIAMRRLALKGTGLCVIAGERAVTAGLLPRLMASFGSDRVFADLCCDGRPRWRERAARVLALARAARVAPVATFAGKSGLASPEEAVQRFDLAPEAVENTIRLAERIEPPANLAQPRSQRSRARPETASLRTRVLDALCARVDASRAGAYVERLDAELAAAEECGLSGAFLRLADLVADLRAAGVPVGTGRGAIADTLISWLLGVTAPDPVALSLSFERHLAGPGSGVRTFAIDVGARGQAAGHRLLRARHGADRVGQTVTPEGAPSSARLVVSDRPLREVAPLRQGAARGVIDVLAPHAPDFGLWCVDLLPRPDLDRLAAAEARARAADPAFDQDATQLDDRETLRALVTLPALDSTVFAQRGFQSLLADVDPASFADVVAAFAVWRPGPLEAGLDRELIDRRHGRVPAEPPVACLAPFLADTRGLLLFQEQAIRIARELGGLDGESAVLLWRALGKRHPGDTASGRAAFLRGATAAGRPESEAAAAFDLMATFAPHLFCKGHVACEVLLAWRWARATMVAGTVMR